MTTDNLTTDRPTSSTEWADAFHNYRRKEAERNRVGAKMNAAEEAALQDRPQRDLQAEYGNAARFNDRPKILEELRYYPARAYAEAAVAGTPPSDADIDALYRDIPRIADEIMAHHQAVKDANERHRVRELEEAYNEAADAFWEARAKLLATPAPDAEAMLTKLDLIAADMAENCADDADAVATLRDDAKRLLGRA